MPDSDKNPEPRVYGQADDANRIPPGPEGMRGEQGNTFADPAPEQTAEERVQGGNITVTEVSGTAFAEKTGRSGLAREGTDEKAD